MAVLCVAGEASGDQLLAPILAGLGPTTGVGGDLCAAAGLNLLGHARDLGAHGFSEALSTLPAWLSAYRRTVAALPGVSAALLVDFPELNMRLLRRAKRRGIPVAYLAPPQAWAWRPWRARDLQAADWVGCLLPFAAEWYASRGVPAHWVGHPLAGRPAPPLPPTDGVCLLPGSREPTVRRLFPVMLAAVARIGLPAHLAVAATVDRDYLARAVDAAGLDVTLHDSAPAALAASSVALAGAGTATLESALAGRPVVTLAKMHGSTAAVLRRLVRTEHLALPNLVLGRRAFPECVQAACDAPTVALAARRCLTNSYRDALAELRARMDRPDYAQRVTAGVVALAERANR